MKLIRMWCALLLLLAVVAPGYTAAETRNIYVGDIITLEITSHGLSEEEIRQQFQSFEIVTLKKEAERYLLSIRTFETGEHTILLGDKELIINIASTLEDIQREDIFEGEKVVIAPEGFFPIRFLSYTAGGIFLLSGALVLLKAYRGRKVAPQNPYQCFLRCSASLASADDQYLVELTLCFKEYLEGLQQRRIIGKTSAEIMRELESTEDILPYKAVLPDIRQWLADCDRFKFAGIEASDEEKRRHYLALLSIAEKIDQSTATKSMLGGKQIALENGQE